MPPHAGAFCLQDMRSMVLTGADGRETLAS
jgi:hypothetical protein